MSMKARGQDGFRGSSIRRRNGKITRAASENQGSSQGINRQLPRSDLIGLGHFLCKRSPLPFTCTLNFPFVRSVFTKNQATSHT